MESFNAEDWHNSIALVRAPRHGANTFITRLIKITTLEGTGELPLYGQRCPEAMLKVKMDLGSEAIILSTRKVPKGIAGCSATPDRSTCGYR